MISIPLLLLSFGLYAFKTGFMSSAMIACAFIISGMGAIQLFKRHQFLSFLFVTGYLLMYFPNPFLVSLGVLPLESTTSLHTYALTNSVLVLGLALFFMGTYMVKSVEADHLRIRIYLDRRVLIFILTLLFGLAFIAICLAVVVIGRQTFQMTRVELIAEAGIVRLISLYMFFPFLVAGPLLIVQLSRPLRTIPWILTIVLLVVHFYIFRARTPFVTVLSSIAIGSLLKNRVLFFYGAATERRFRSVRDFLVIAVIGLVILIGGVVSTFIRGYIGLGGIELSHGYAQVWLEKTFDGGDLGYQKVQRAAYVTFPRQHQFLLGQSYYRVLLVPMPRFIMPNKPLNTQRIFCAVINPEMAALGGTIPPGILGDLYINFGHFGVIGMFIYGLIIGRERYYRLWHWLMLGGSMSWLFHFVRGGFTNPFVTFLVFLIISKLLEKGLSPYYESHELPEYYEYDQLDGAE